MTIATDRRTGMLQAIAEWADLQAKSGRRPDGYIGDEDGEELAQWRCGEFSYNGRPVYVTERGQLIVWESYRQTEITWGLFTGRYREWTETWWVVNAEDDESDDEPPHPNLHGTRVSTENLEAIARYLASITTP